jgi:predicted small lipoprotein YifL
MLFRTSSLAAALVLAGSLTACGPTDLPTSAGSAASAANAGSGQSSDAVRVRIALVAPSVGAPFRRAKGAATFKSRRAQRELEMEVEHLRPGTQVDFFVGGAQVGGRSTANEFGQAGIDLNTRLGDQVPLGVAGQTAEARTVTGAVIVSGTF